MYSMASNSLDYIFKMLYDVSVSDTSTGFADISVLYYDGVSIIPGGKNGHKIFCCRTYTDSDFRIA